MEQGLWVLSWATRPQSFRRPHYLAIQPSFRGGRVGIVTGNHLHGGSISLGNAGRAQQQGLWPCRKTGVKISCEGNHIRRCKCKSIGRQKSTSGIAVVSGRPPAFGVSVMFVFPGPHPTTLCAACGGSGRGTNTASSCFQTDVMTLGRTLRRRWGALPVLGQRESGDLSAAGTTERFRSRPVCSVGRGRREKR